MRMIRLHRKWWLLRELRNECRKNARKQLSLEQLYFNAQFSVAREALVKQVVRRSMERFSGIFIWKKGWNDKKAKKRTLEYNSIFDELIRGKLVFVEEYNSLKADGHILNPPGRPFFRTTDLGDKYISEFWYKTYLDNAYLKTIIIAGIVAILGIYIRQLFNDVNQPPVINVYPSIDSPDFNPVINVYTDREPSQQ